MKYEEALLDANLALKIVPDCLDAYHLVSDCLIATSKYTEAAKILNLLLCNDPNNSGLHQQIKMINMQAQPNTSQSVTDEIPMQLKSPQA